MSISKYSKEIIDLFETHADADNARQMEAYMRDRFKFFGLKAPFRRSLIKEFYAENPPPSNPAEAENLIFELFALPERELHHTAIEMCARVKKHWNRDSLDLFERMIVTRSWWDSVDAINSLCLKPYFLIFQEDRYSRTLDWIESGNIWLQRVSLIFQLKYKDKTDTELLTRNILLLRDSDEFFVQKAIGWVLRDYGHTHPEWVIDFVRKNELKPLSKREALKKIRIEDRGLRIED